MILPQVHLRTLLRLLLLLGDQVLVHGYHYSPQSQPRRGSAVAQSFRTEREKHADPSSVARVRPRTSKGVTDLLLLPFMRLKAVYASKKKLV